MAAAPPEGMTPRSHWTTFEPSERPQVTWLGIAETNSILAGRWSLTLHSRSEGRTSVFSMVNVTVPQRGRYRGLPSWLGVADRKRRPPLPRLPVSILPHDHEQRSKFSHILLLPSFFI